MKMINLFAASMISLILYSSCSHDVAPVGHYQDTPVAADGNIDDWNLPLRFSNPEHTYQYSVTNDKKNIYICILSKDEATQMRMLRAGINIYFDPKGEKNKNIDLEFPLRKAEASSYNNGDPITPSKTRMSKNELLLQSDYYNTAGFANIENGQFAVADKKSSIQVALKLQDDSTLVYEAIVPVADIPGFNPYGKKANKNFSVGITVNNSIRRNNNANNSPRPSYGGGMRGMGMRMGGGGYRGGQRSQPPKEEVNWYVFRPAFDKNNK